MCEMRIVALAVVLGVFASAAAGQETTGVLEAKVTDVTIFKGGAGIFRFEGEGVVKDGRLVVKDAPTPAFGTLWFWALDSGVTVTSVNSEQLAVERERGINDTWELLRSNCGKEARIVMKDGESKGETGAAQDWQIEGKIVSVSADRQVMLKTEEGVVACPVGQMRYAVVADAETTETTESRKLSMYVKLKGAEDGRKVRVGYSCLEAGIRWLPAYRMDLDGGKVRLALSASVMNDAVDIQGARASFVVGRPLFTLAGQAAPVSQANVLFDLSKFREQEAANVHGAGKAASWDELIGANLAQQGLTNAAYPDTVDSETAGRTISWDRIPEIKWDDAAQGVAVASSFAEAYHLFYYTAEEVTVARDTSANVVLWTAENPVEHLFVWKVAMPQPYQTPAYAKRLREIYGGGLFTSGSVEDKSKTAVSYEEAIPPMHCLKMTNETGESWASAPLLVYEKGRALGQVWMQYTPGGREAKVVIGTATDIVAHKAQREIAREIEAQKQGKQEYDLVTTKGFLKLENKRDEKVQVEAKVELVGTPVAYEKGAEVTTLRGAGSGLNPETTMKWKVDVEAGKEKELIWTYKTYVRH